MAIEAEAVEILVKKARFTPEVAVGVAEAIGVSINMAQLATVPILDARLEQLRHELKAAMEEIKADLVRWVFLTMLGNVALGALTSHLLKGLTN
jgi:hypothetical protein